MNYSTLDKPTLDYSQILSCFRYFVEFDHIIGHTWQEGARRIPVNLIEYSTWYMNAENNYAEVVLNK